MIDELRNNQSTQYLISQPLGSELINALYKNDTKKSSRLLKNWIGIHPSDLDASMIYSSVLRKQMRFLDAEQLLFNNATKWKDNSSFIMETALVKLALKKDAEGAKLLAPLLTAGAQQQERYKYLSNSLLDMKMFTASDEYFEKAMAIGSNMYDYQRRARKYALIGENTKAFQNLEKSVKLGQISKQEFEGDEDLKSLKTDARWKVLIGKMK